MKLPIVYSTTWSPPSCAVRMTAKAIGLELNIQEINLLKGEHLTKDFRKLNPQQSVPTLNDNGFILCDSHAIMTYLVGKYSKSDALYPKDLNKRAMVDQRLYFNSSVLSVRTKDAVQPILRGQSKIISTESKQLVFKACDLLNEFLSGKSWLAGDSYTLADISCCSYINNFKIAFPIDNYPNIVSWMEKCEEHIPGFEEIATSGAKQVHKIMNHLLKQ
ncbi:hypothetical protein PV326_003268 [Microctonus aethiopoides]|nr:hypothetical protein PV326_003268 [Microctonus aethiopoides]